MSRSKPEFHLQRLNGDGSSEPPLIYSLGDLPLDTPLKRRGFLGAGVAVGNVLTLGCNLQPAEASETGLRVGDNVVTMDAVHLMDGTIRVTTFPKGRRLRVLRLQGDWVRVVTLDLTSPKEGWLKRAQVGLEETASSSNTPVERPTTRSKGRPAATIYAHRDSVIALAITPDGQFLGSGSFDKTVKLWSLPEGNLKTTLVGHDDPLRAVAITLAITPACKLLVSGSIDEMVKLWSLSEGMLNWTELHRGISWNAVRALAITPDGKLLAMGSIDETVKLWSLPEGMLKTRLDQHGGGVNAVAITPDGKLLASGSNDKTVKLWSLPEANLKTTLVGHDDPVRALAITPDGKLLASGSNDKTVKLWSLPEGNLKTTLDQHSGEVNALAITPDGKLLASGSNDKTVKLWSLPEGTLKTTLDQHRGEVNALAITPDGTLLASGDSNGVIILWDLTTMERRSYLFDPKASKTDAFAYKVKDRITGQTLTFTLPCGSPIPAGAVCTCNCVPGTYGTPSVSKKRPTPKKTPLRHFRGGGSYCTCNKICTCIPVCQAHRLLHPDPIIRTMSEQLLLVMGEREFPYMTWAAGQSESMLKEHINRTMNAIRAGAKPDPARWPSLRACAARLDDGDEVIRIMAAQMIALQARTIPHRLTPAQRDQVNELLLWAQCRPWSVRGS